MHDDCEECVLEGQRNEPGHPVSSRPFQSPSVDLRGTTHEIHLSSMPRMVGDSDFDAVTGVAEYPP